MDIDLKVMGVVAATMVSGHLAIDTVGGLIAPTYTAGDVDENGEYTPSFYIKRGVTLAVAGAMVYNGVAMYKMIMGLKGA